MAHKALDKCNIYHQALLVFAAQDVQTAVVGIREKTWPAKRMSLSLRLLLLILRRNIFFVALSIMFYYYYSILRPNGKFSERWISNNVGSDVMNMCHLLCKVHRDLNNGI